MDFTIYQELWCLFNSPFLRTFASFVTFGSIPFIVPKLFFVPPKQTSTTPGDVLHINKAIKHMVGFGLATLVSSILTICYYILIWLNVDGNTKCDNNNKVNSLLTFNTVNDVELLYLFSILTIILIGFFYQNWRIVDKEIT